MSVIDLFSNFCFFWTCSKLKDLMSPIIDHNQLMDFVDGYGDPDLGPTQTLDVNTRSPPIITYYNRSQSPMHSGDSNNNNNNHGTRSQRRASATNSPRRSATNSPKRMLVEEESGSKSPQHVPCISDIGTIVRRVRNVRIGFPNETRVFAYTTETCV